MVNIAVIVTRFDVISYFYYFYLTEFLSMRYISTQNVSVLLV